MPCGLADSGQMRASKLYPSLHLHMFPSTLRPAGKTSLLQVLAGKYMVGQDTVRILGRPAFHDIHLVSAHRSGACCSVCCSYVLLQSGVRQPTCRALCRRPTCIPLRLAHCTLPAALQVSSGALTLANSHFLRS